MTECVVTALGVAQVPIEEIVKLRRKPAPLPEVAASALALRHADEHTLAALEALLSATTSAGIELTSLRDWGVLVSSRFPGRVGLAVLLHRFAKLGPLGVSPMSVPTQSMHSAAGTLSLVLGMNGPNFGVSGGPGHVNEAILAGMTLAKEGLAPGVFTVMTASDPELAPDRQGKISGPGSFHAVALGLAPAGAEGLFTLRYVPGDPVPWTPTSLLEFRDYLKSDERRWACPLPGGGHIEMERLAQARAQAA